MTAFTLRDAGGDVDDGGGARQGAPQVDDKCPGATPAPGATSSPVLSASLDPAASQGRADRPVEDPASLPHAPGGPTPTPTSTTPRSPPSQPPRERIPKKKAPTTTRPSQHIILPDASIESFAAYLVRHRCRRIIVMTGAGISTSCGIPDFRSPGTGLYANLAKYHLPYPEAVFDIAYFRRNPRPFYCLARELYPGQFRPSPAHHFVRRLQERGMLLRNYTQNIDTLERIAGLPAEVLVEAHGSFASAVCAGRQWTRLEDEEQSSSSSSGSSEDEGTDEDVGKEDGGGVRALPSPPAHIPEANDEEDLAVGLQRLQLQPAPRPAARITASCGRVHDADWVKAKLFPSREPTSTSDARGSEPQAPHDADDVDIPICQEIGCGGYVKPSITFFGEALPRRFHDLVPRDFAEADALIVMGTSLKVEPFCGLLHLVRPEVPRLLINREVCGVYPGSAHRGFDFGGERHPYRRDALFLGTCDEGCRRLAELLGWGDPSL